MRMGYMASELKRLASKVHKNEQRTSFLQVSQPCPFGVLLFCFFFPFSFNQTPFVAAP